MKCVLKMVHRGTERGEGGRSERRREEREKEGGQKGGRSDGRRERRKEKREVEGGERRREVRKKGGQRGRRRERRRRGRPERCRQGERKERISRRSGTYRDDQGGDSAGEACERTANVEHPEVLCCGDDGEAEDEGQRAEHQTELPANPLHQPTAEKTPHRGTQRYYGLKHRQDTQ